MNHRSELGSDIMVKGDSATLAGRRPACSTRLNWHVLHSLLVRPGMLITPNFQISHPADLCELPIVQLSSRKTAEAFSLTYVNVTGRVQGMSPTRIFAGQPSSATSVPRLTSSNRSVLGIQCGHMSGWMPMIQHSRTMAAFLQISSSRVFWMEGRTHRV